MSKTSGNTGKKCFCLATFFRYRLKFILFLVIFCFSSELVCVLLFIHHFLEYFSRFILEDYTLVSSDQFRGYELKGLQNT